MLRRTRIFVIIFFLFSVSVWGGYKIYARSHADTSSPVITMDETSVTVSVEDGDKGILEGVRAEDKKDGDLTDQIFIESRSNFIEKGRFTVTFAVADSDNHVSKASREVTYSDYHSPRFELSQPLKFQTTSETMDDLNIAANLSASDVIDGNISNKIRISGDYSISGTIPGDYPMEFLVTNSMGDTTRFPVTVTIYSSSEESALPAIRLKYYLVNTSVGNEIDLESLVEEVSYHGYSYHQASDGKFYSGEYDKDGQPLMFDAAQLHLSTDVDFNTPGVYEVSVTYTEERDGVSNAARMYVVVNE